MSGMKPQNELHTPQIPKDDPECFSLEDILREFGAPVQTDAKPSCKNTAESSPHELIREMPPLSHTVPEIRSAREVDSDVNPQGKRGDLLSPSREQTETDKQIYQHLDMVQAGFTGRRVRLVLCALLSALAVGAVIARLIPRTESYGTSGMINLVEFGIMILCAMLSMDVFFAKRDGFAGVGFGYRLLMLYELILSILCDFLLLTQGQDVICAPVCLVLTFSLLGIHIRAKGFIHTLEASQVCTQGDTLYWEADFENRKPGILSGRGSKAVLLRGNAVKPAPQRAINLYAYLVIFVSLATMVLLPRDNPTDMLRNALTVALMGTPLSALLVWFLPWSVLARRMHQIGAALCGWRGIKRAARNVTVPLSDEDLFPSNFMRLNGVKFYGGADPDKVVSYAASLMDAAGGGSKEILSQQAELRGRCLHPVQRFRRYDSGGVSGEIGEDSVLVGTMRFLQAMGVSLPGGTKVSQAIYVSINGDLSGVFAINYGIAPEGAEAMSGLASYRKATPIITAVDFMVTDSLLRAKYQIDTAKFVTPLLSQKAQLLKRKPSDTSIPCAIYGEDRLPVTVLTLRGSRALRNTSRWCAIGAILGGLFGLLIAAVLLLSKGVAIHVEDVLCYQLFWLLSVWSLSLGMKLI